MWHVGNFSLYVGLSDFYRHPNFIVFSYYFHGWIGMFDAQISIKNMAGSIPIDGKYYTHDPYYP